MKKIIIIILIAILAIILLYMLKQNHQEPLKQVDNVSTVIVVDEQALALEEMKKSVGKSGLSKLYIVKCSSCHGRDGKGPVGASIAGKDAKYNLEVLLKYKNNQVPNTLMKGLLENTTESELSILADEISSFK